MLDGGGLGWVVLGWVSRLMGWRSGLVGLRHDTIRPIWMSALVGLVSINLNCSWVLGWRYFLYGGCPFSISQRFGPVVQGGVFYEGGFFLGGYAGRCGFLS